MKDAGIMFSTFGYPYADDLWSKFRGLIERIQSDLHLQHAILAFLVGFALGCFVTAFFRTMNVQTTSNSKLDRLAGEYDHLAARADKKRRLNEYRTKDGRTFDEVERDARRRL